jgi:hypothetical protein
MISAMLANGSTKLVISTPLLPVSKHYHVNKSHNFQNYYSELNNLILTETNFPIFPINKSLLEVDNSDLPSVM